MASKTDLSKVGGYYPVIESIIRETSVMTAIVFGVAWRYCQMVTGFCTASQVTIGEILGLDRHTVAKHLAILVEKGYFTTTTGEKGAIYYHDTGKPNITEVMVNNLPDDGKKVTRSWHKSYHPDGKKPATIKESNRNTIKDIIKETPLNIPHEMLYPMAQALSEVTGISYKVNDYKLKTAAREILQDDRMPTPAMILKDYGINGDWYKKDWRGKKNQRPSLANIKETLFNLRSGKPKEAQPTEEEYAQMRRELKAEREELKRQEAEK
jgi:hypothetical protein